MITCPQCKNQNQDGAAFCDSCGASLAAAAAQRPGAVQASPAAPAGSIMCPVCNTPALPGTAFCDNCGASLQSVPISAPSQQAYMPPAAPAYVPPPQPPYVPAAAPAQPFVPPQAPSAAGTVRCPICGSSNGSAQAYCDNCGASLAGAAALGGAQAGLGVPGMAGGTVLHPRLVVTASGVQIDLTGKADVLIGRADPVSGVFPDVDLTTHGGEEGGVSRKHAKLTLRGGQCTVEDLQSVNCTFVNSQKLNPGIAQPIKDGDQIRLGRVVLMFYTN